MKLKKVDYFLVLVDVSSKMVANDAFNVETFLITLGRLHFAALAYIVSVTIYSENLIFVSIS